MEVSEQGKKYLNNLKNWAVFVIIINTIGFFSSLVNLYKNMTMDIEEQLANYKDLALNVQEAVRLNLEVSASPAMITLNSVIIMFTTALIYYLFNFIKKCKAEQLPEPTAIYLGFAKVTFAIIVGGIQSYMLDPTIGNVFWFGISGILIASIIGYIIYSLMYSNYTKAARELAE